MARCLRYTLLAKFILNPTPSSPFFFLGQNYYKSNVHFASSLLLNEYILSPILNSSPFSFKKFRLKIVLTAIRPHSAQFFNEKFGLEVLLALSHTRLPIGFPKRNMSVYYTGRILFPFGIQNKKRSFPRTASRNSFNSIESIC